MLKKIGIGLVFINVAVFSFYAGTVYKPVPKKSNPILLTMELDKEQNVTIAVNKKKCGLKLVTDSPKKVEFLILDPDNFGHNLGKITTQVKL